MNILEFAKAFPDEESCEMRLKEYRLKKGVVCPHCGSTEHYWKSDKKSFECKKCRYRQSLKANTAMHGSKLPLRYWFIAITLLSSTKNSFSALELQRLTEHKNYNPIWALAQKVREAMGKRDDRYQMSGMMELDDGFFTTETPEEERGKKLKRGRGSQRKSKVLVMASVKEGKPTKSHDKPTAVRYIKMQVMEDLKAKTVDAIVSEMVNKDAKIVSDDSTSYVNLKDYVAEHNPTVIPKKDTGKVLPWVHIAISNAKRLFLNVFHTLSPKYIQNYINEFCWKFNRRYFGDGLFDRLIITVLDSKNTFRYNI